MLALILDIFIIIRRVKDGQPTTLPLKLSNQISISIFLAEWVFEKQFWALELHKIKSTQGVYLEKERNFWLCHQLFLSSSIFTTSPSTVSSGSS